MKIAIITQSCESGAIADWIAENVTGSAELEHWIIDPEPTVAEQVLDALASQWLQTPADILIFPAGSSGDELATRLAWRLHGSSVCQILTLDVQQRLVTKSHWGNALIATLHVTSRPLCLSLARQTVINVPGNTLPAMTACRIVPAAPPEWLDEVESVQSVRTHPLSQASHVLVVGQGGGDVEPGRIAHLAQKLNIELGYSRARVMNGGVDAERMVGISGHILSPDVCIVAGASGAAALMAGVRQSQFVVAINTDPNAPVFAQADVGIVDDWLPVLESLCRCLDT